MAITTHESRYGARRAWQQSRERARAMTSPVQPGIAASPRPDPATLTATAVLEAAKRHGLTLDHDGGWYSAYSDGRKLCCPAIALAIDCDPTLIAPHAGWAALDQAAVERATGLPKNFVAGLAYAWDSETDRLSTSHDEEFRCGWRLGREVARRVRDGGPAS